MGLIRLLLAISILLYHTGPVFGISLLENHIAVQSFFIISGFYMALILNKKYIGSNNSYSLFLKNRILRIFPIYWFILGLTLLTSFMLLHFHIPNPLDVYITADAHLPYKISAIISQILHNAFLLFSLDYINPIHYVNQINLIVLQAWTLKVEFLFYFLAPFIVKKEMKFIIALISASFLLRILTYNFHIFGPSIVDQVFFPNQLIFFLFGVAAFRIYEKLLLHHNPNMIKTGVGLLLLTVFSIGVYPYLPSAFRIGDFHIINWLFEGLLTVSIPYIFIMSATLKWDRVLGNISYPLYISHLFVLLIFTTWMNAYHTKISPNFFSVSILVLSICFSIGLMVFIDSPIDKYRQRRFKK